MDLAKRKDDASRTKVLDRREQAFALLSMALVHQNPSNMKEQTTAAPMNGATHEELESIYDCVLLTQNGRETIYSLPLFSEHLDTFQDHNRPASYILQLCDHATLVRDTGGPGFPIVLLHGLSLDSSMYRGIYPRLSKNARVIMYDIRGFGYAQNAPLVKDFSQLADGLAAILDTLSIDAADVYGTSYSGAIAQQMALQHPQRVRSVAMLASLTKGFPVLLERATNAEQYGMEFMVPPTLMRWFSPESIARNVWVVRYARTCVTRAKVE